MIFISFFHGKNLIPSFYCARFVPSNLMYTL